MPTYGGWTGKTLRVDLTTRKSTVEDTLAKYGEWWGGTGMAYKVLWDETTGTTDPLSPENKIIFGWGPLTGTGAPCGGRTCITALSPQHPFGAVATGHMGGHFSAEAKYAGWDGIIIEGKASGPVYIAIHDDDVKIVDAPQLWGNGIYRVTAEIVQAMGGGSCQVAAIGQGGQNLVAQSVVMTGYSHSAGGQGAVMGSKNLLGIGVVGSGSVKIAGAGKAWRNLIDYAMSLVGSNNQAVVPNSPQPWSEYVSSARWYAKKGQYWGAAEPPVETGTCEPHDRQSVGYRCFKSDPGAFAEQFTVRMDGCHACPVRCHQDLLVPTAAKWGVDPTASNTCTGWWGRGLMDAAKVKAGAGSGVQDQNLRALESYVVGKHMTDDFGLHNNYGLTDRGWSFILNKGPAGNATHATADATTLKNAGKAAVKLSWLQTALLNPTWDWTNVASAAAVGSDYVALAGLTTTAKASLLFGLYDAGDLNFLMTFGKMMAGKTTELGKFLGDPVEAALARWEVKAPGITAAYHADSSVQWWNYGFPKHHSLENGGQVGGLINVGYNRDSQNHCWSNYLSCGLPGQLIKDIASELFADAGYTTGSDGKAVDWADAVELGGVTSTPMNRAKAMAAIWATARKELTDALGICSWMWPWIPSPLRERNYRGDIGLEAKLFSLATGRNMTTKEFDREGVKFYVLQRALTERSFKAEGAFPDSTKSMRTLHDTLPPWGYAHDETTAFTGTNYYETVADWETALDLYYEELGFDKATGLVTRATLESYGMKDVADQLGTLGLLPA